MESADRLLRLNQIIPDILPISKTSWWNGVKSGLYPQPVKLGPRTTAWRESDISKVVALGTGGKRAAQKAIGTKAPDSTDTPITNIKR